MSSATIYNNEGAGSKNRIVVYDDRSYNSKTKKQLTKNDLEVAVRQTNPAELNTAPPDFWDPEDTLRTGVIDNSNVKQQLNIVENGVLYSAKLYNDLKVKNDILAKKLKKKLDDLDEQRKNFENLNALKNAETSDSIRIEELKHEAREVQEVIAKHTHYGRQLDHVLSRLKNNQLKLSSHIVDMEQTMPAIIKEQDDVSHLHRCLGVALGKAALVLEETRTSLELARKDREGLMRKRLDEVHNAEMLQEWMNRRQEAKASLAMELRGELTAAEEQFLLNQINARVEETKALQKESEASTHRLLELEMFFIRLKQVSGVTVADRMADKFSDQKVNKLDLEREASEAERRLSVARRELQTCERTFQDLQSSGSSQSDLTRAVTERFEAEIEQARGDKRLWTAQAERLNTILLSLQQGCNGLLLRMTPFAAEIASDLGGILVGPGGAMRSTRNSMISTQGQNDGGGRTLVPTLEALNTTEMILTKMMEAVSAASNDAVGVTLAASGSIASMSSTGSQSEDDPSSWLSANDTSLDALSTVNVRVKSHRKQREQERLSRERDKTGTPQLLSQSQPQRSRERGGMRGGDRQLNSKDEILSRESLKLRSERRLREEIHRLEREKKKKTLLQQGVRRRSVSHVPLQRGPSSASILPVAAGTGRSSNTMTSSGAGNGTPSSGNGAVPLDDEEDGRLAADQEYQQMARNLAKREQRDYCNKLSRPLVNVDAVNVRADVLTKVKAFFDRKPQLE